MATTQTGGEHLTEAPPFVGREIELAALLGLVDDDNDVRVGHVVGVGGIGKSALLRVLRRRAAEAGVAVVSLEGREVEPSPSGLLDRLAASIGAEDAELAHVVERLHAAADRVMIAMDTYEVLRLADGFVRDDLGPSLPPNCSLVLSGRDDPVAPWYTDEWWMGRVRTIHLGPLSRQDSLEYLDVLGVDPRAAAEIFATARGHPLAMRLAAAMTTAVGGGPTDVRTTTSTVVDRLATEYLATVADGEARRALEALSVVRRITESLAAALVPDVPASTVVRRLEQLPFVEMGADGLIVHDVVRDAVATRLAAVAPDRYQRYRSDAWHQLQSEMDAVPDSVLWRYTADLLHLLDRPEIREAFFPTGQQPLVVEAAAGDDAGAIDEITATHAGPDERTALAAWWRFAPGAFMVCRDGTGAVVAYCIAARRTDLTDELLALDPVAARWQDSLAAIDGRHDVFLFRRFLDAESGEAQCGSSGAFGLDLKRSYMEMRPRLRYLYTCGTDPAEFEWAVSLGFEHRPELVAELDGRTTHSWRLDMGPRSVDGWLARLAADGIGVDTDGPAGVFDRDRREIALPDGERRHLTPLEYAVMEALCRRDGRIATRADLLAEVWGFDSDATSNVVDTVVAGLRRKLGPRRDLVETVRGAGYRYSAP